MAYIFISHSKHDDDIKKFFSLAIGRTDGLNHIMIELEDLKYEYAGNIIRDIISIDCIGLIVLLGKHVQYPPIESRQHTHNWVSFEIGVAAGVRKPIVVFEEFKDNIDFPIPYLTDYVRYQLDNKEHLQKIGQVLKMIMPSRLMAPDVLQCLHSNCNAVYYFWSVRKPMHCPACRQEITFGEPINRNIPYRFDFKPSIA